MRQSTDMNTNRFSLIELIIVIVIISVMLAIATPKLGHFYHGLKLNQTARQMMIYLNAARDTAVFEKRLCRVIVDSSWQQLTLEVQEDPVNEPDKFVSVGVDGVEFIA